MKTIYSYILTICCCLICAYVFSQQQLDKVSPQPRIIIAPNPVSSGYFVVETDSCTYDHFDRIVIYNSNGVMLQNKQLAIYKGSSKQQVDIAGYTPGNYFVRIIDNKNPYFSFARQIVVE